MTSETQIERNRRNGRKSSGPRTAAGKAKASRNALRHGLAAITHRQYVSSGEIEKLAKAICGDDPAGILFAKAIVVAQKQLVLQVLHEQRVAIVERLREMDATAFVNGNNGRDLAAKISKQSDCAYAELVTLLPVTLAKYKDQLPAKLPKFGPAWVYATKCDELVPLELKSLLQESEVPSGSIKEEDGLITITSDRGDAQIKERDELRALQEAAPDLVRLDRYERRAWSQLKKAIREYINVKFMCQVERAKTAESREFPPP